MPKNYPEYASQPISGEDLFTHPPRVSLLALTQSPLPPEEFSDEDWQALNSSTTIAGGSARTCYSKDLITPLDYVNGTAKHRQTTDAVVTSTREAGHLSTRQHVNYLFALEGVSRVTVHSLLHSYPFHNSDQVSQRYTPMTEEGLVLPVLEHPRLNEAFHSAAVEMVAGYHHLTDLLVPIAREFYLKRFPVRRDVAWQKKVNLEATKKAQEISRYLLPLAMGANLYHSVSALTLMRYHRLSETYLIQPEARLLINAMVDSVAAVDPSILSELDAPLSPDYLHMNYPLPEPDSPDYYRAADLTDDYLAGLSARLDLSDAAIFQKLAHAVRLTLGPSVSALPDETLIDLVLNPAKNKLLASTYGEMTMHQLSQTLNQVSLSATISLSHSADSQLQRHRSFHHTQPLILAIPREDRDIVVPLLLRYSQPALDYYLKMQAQNISVLEELYHSGVSLDQLAYLQTNGTRIRKRISGPLGAFYHWLKIRTCLSAQEEIYGLAIEIARQIPSLDPLVGKHFDKPAPCGVRQKAGVTPFCSESDHYCGIPIWKKSIAAYPQRDI